MKYNLNSYIPTNPKCLFRETDNFSRNQAKQIKHKKWQIEWLSQVRNDLIFLLGQFLLGHGWWSTWYFVNLCQAINEKIAVSRCPKAKKNWQLSAHVLRWDFCWVAFSLCFFCVSKNDNTFRKAGNRNHFIFSKLVLTFWNNFLTLFNVLNLCFPVPFIWYYANPIWWIMQ